MDTKQLRRVAVVVYPIYKEKKRILEQPIVKTHELDPIFQQ